MESSLVSWQFSTAELSPPVSPVSSPSSPLFYDGSNPSSPYNNSIKGNAFSNKLSTQQQQSQKPALGSVLSSRAQAATNMLNELERLHFVEDQNGFGINQNEESVDLNMDLFEELQDIEFTPPLLSSSDDKFEVPTASASVPAVLPVPVSSTGVVIPSEDKLSAEYKSILESLSTSNKGNSSVNSSNTITNKGNTFALGGLFQGAGIPTTTIVGDECLVPVEFIGRPSAKNGSIGEEEAESMDLDGIIISDDIAFINENELFSLGELSAELATEETSNSGTASNNATLVNGVMPYWAKDMTIPLDSLDTKMNQNDEVLDALLKGDVSAAKSVITSPYLPTLPIEDSYSPISQAYVSDDDDSIIVEEKVQPAEVIPQSVVVEAKKKPERRGRKSTKKDKNSLTYIKDKTLRKKEQNKTAATRYRQKKKQELAITLAEEDDLQEVHDELEKQKDKLKSEIGVIRGLLREMLTARKQRVSPASTSITASALLQAQRIAKNRK